MLYVPKHLRSICFYRRLTIEKIELSRAVSPRYFIRHPVAVEEALYIIFRFNTATVYVDHLTRIRAGGAILMISGGFYLPFSAAISNQIRRIPRCPYMIHQLQLSSASAGVWTFILPGVVLCIASFRPDRPPAITQMLNEFFWIVAL